MSDVRINTVIDADAKRFQTAIAGVLHSFGDLRSAHDKTTATSRVLERQTKDLTRALQDQNRSLATLTLNFRAFRNAMLGLGLTFAIAGFTSLAASVASLGGGMVEMAAQAVKAGAALGVLGTAGMAAIGQGALVAVLGLKNVSKALITTGQDHEKAMAKLTTPARAFVGQIHDMQIAFREVQLIAQVGLFPGIVAGIKAAQPVLQDVKQVVYDTATTMGYLADKVGILVGKRASDLKAFGERNVVTLRRMGDSGLYLADAFLQIMRAADPFIGHVTAGMVTLSRSLDDAAIHARKDGSFGSFFFDLRKSWDVWTSTFGAVAIGLFHVFQAASGPSNDVAKSIHQVAVDFERWTGSTAGQDKMAAFFTESNQVLGSMARFVGALAKDLAGLATMGGGGAQAFFDMLRIHVLPVLDELGKRLSSGLFPNLIKFTGAFADFIAAALPGLTPLSNAISHLVDALVGVLKVTTPLIGQLPGITKLFAALVIGGAVIGTWTKLTDLIGLAFLRLKMFVGLAPEMGGFGAVAQSILFRGGKNQAADVAGVAAAGGGGGGGGAGGGMAFVPSRRASIPTITQASGFKFATAQDAQNLLAWNREAERAAAAGEKLGRVAKAYAGPINVLTGLGRGIGIVHTPSGDRSASTGQFVPNEANRGILAGTSAARPSTARERLDAQSFDLTGKGTFTRFAENVGGATHAGVVKGITLAKPVLGAAFATMAVSGIIGGITSQSRTIAGRLTDVLSGATFGLLPSTSDKQGGVAATLAKMLSGGSLDFGALGQKTDLSRVFGKGGLNVASFFGTGGMNGGNQKLTINTADSVEKLKAVIDQLGKVGAISADDQDKFNKFADALTGRIANLGPQAAKLKGAIDSGLDLGGAQAHVITSVDRIKGALDDMQRSGGLSAKQLAVHVQTNMSILNAELGRGTTSGRLALAKNFNLAAAAVKQSMDAGTISTKTGLALINTYMEKALEQFGLSKKQAGRFLAGNDTLTGKPTNAPAGAGHARGGLHTLPGQPGPDSIPGVIGGQRIVAAPGEDVAVFTRHQRKVADRALAPLGGLAGLFSNVRTPHAQADVKGFASGGLLPGYGSLSLGRIDQGVDFGGAGPVQAVLDGTVLRNKEWPGWPGTGGMVYRTGRGNIYVMEDFAPSVGDGQHVKIGDVIGRATGGHSGIETGWANAAGTAPLDQYNGRPDGTATAGGRSFLQFLRSGKGKGALGNLAGGAGGGMAAQIKRVLVAAGHGTLGDVVQAGLDQARNAAQNRVDAAASSMGGTGSLDGFHGGGDAAANRSLGKRMAAAFGWTGDEWGALDKLWTRESGWRNVMNTAGSGAGGIPQALPMSKMASAGKDWLTNIATQIKWGLGYIKGRYGDPVGAWAHETSHNWYSEGGLLEAFAGTLFSVPPPPPRNGGVPNVNPNQAITPGSVKHKKKPVHKKKAAKKKKHKKPPKPFAGHHPLPNTGAIHGDKVHTHDARKKKHKGLFYPKLAGGSDVAEKLLAAAIPDYQALFEDPLTKDDNLLTVLQGKADLTDEQAVVTLTDSGSFADLSAFWAAHPDLAATYKDQLDSFDVVNTGGYTVQGQFIPGISQHVNELIAQLGVHTGSADPSGVGGEIGLYQGYIAAIMKKGLPATMGLRDQAISELKRLHTHWDMWQGRRQHDNAELAKLHSGGRSWEQRVADNKARIKTLQDYKRQIHADAVGHRLTEADQKNLRRADQEIADLGSSSDKLRQDKPPAQHKGESKKQRNARLADIAHLTTDRDDALLRMDELAASRDKWNVDGGLAKDWTDRIATYTQSISDQGDKLAELRESRYPAEQLNVAALAKEMGDWSGTIVPLPKVDATAAATATDNQAALNDLLKQQNQQLLAQFAESQAEKSIFAGFAPLLAKHLVGVFEHGGVVPRTGLALVHQNETIVPDPRGPYGTQAGGSRGGDTSVALHLHGSLGPLMKMIDARIDGRAPKVVNKNIGRDSRSLHFAPGG